MKPSPYTVIIAHSNNSYILVTKATTPEQAALDVLNKVIPSKTRCEIISWYNLVSQRQLEEWHYASASWIVCAIIPGAHSSLHLSYD